MIFLRHLRPLLGKRPSWLLVACSLAAGTLWGCHSTETRPEPALRVTAENFDALHPGYRLLFDLLGDEKDVSKLLVVKEEGPELRTLVKDISDRAGAAHKRMEEIAKANPRLDLKTEVLPVVERQTRDRISQARGKELLRAKGKDLELQLLLTQVEALTYGAHLAAVLAQSETDADRKEFLSRLSAELAQLHHRVLGMLKVGYRTSSRP